MMPKPMLSTPRRSKSSNHAAHAAVNAAESRSGVVPPSRRQVSA
jgi:hypothetical protein